VSFISSRHLSPDGGCYKSPLSPRERVGVRESKKANALITLPPHPRLLPQGEGVRAFCYTFGVRSCLSRTLSRLT